MSIFGCSHDAIESRQRLLVLQPRLSAPARRVNRSGIFYDQAFVGARASGIEKLVDVCSIANRSLIRRADGAAFQNFSETRQALGQWQLEERFAVLVEKIEREECDRRVAQKRL